MEFEPARGRIVDKGLRYPVDYTGFFRNGRNTQERNVYRSKKLLMRSPEWQASSGAKRNPTVASWEMTNPFERAFQPVYPPAVGKAVKVVASRMKCDLEKRFSNGNFKPGQPLVYREPVENHYDWETWPERTGDVVSTARVNLPNKDDMENIKQFYDICIADMNQLSEMLSTHVKSGKHYFVVGPASQSFVNQLKGSQRPVESYGTIFVSW